MSGERRLRVLQVGKFYPPYKGGMESHLEWLCRGLLPQADVQVVVASQTRRGSREVLDRIPVRRLGTLARAASTSITPGLAREIRRAEADVVHVHVPNPAAVLAVLRARPRGAVVTTYHSDIVRQRWLGRAFAPLQHLFLRRSAAIIATSPDYVASSPVLTRHRRRCRVIPHGIPLEGFGDGDGEEAADLRRRYGPRLVLAVGRLIYYKGFDVLIRAMGGVEGRLVIVGTGPMREELAALIRTEGLEDRVVLAGEVPDVAPYYRACDVFALPAIARSEAFGIVQLEAMACGKPVINTRLDSGVPFVSRHQESGLTVAPGDAAELAGALNRLLQDPALAAAYGRAGRRRVEEEFSVEVMARRTLELYREVVGPAASPQEPATGARPRASLSRR